MSRYQVKPVYVDAVQYKKGLEDGHIRVFDEECGHPEKPYINTAQGQQIINEGDFIVTTSEGNKQRYSPDFFHEKFERVAVKK